MADSLKALTITPCWAHAVMHLGKKIENRKWAPSYRGLCSYTRAKTSR